MTPAPDGPGRETGRTVHLGLSVRGALRWPNRDLARMLRHENGKLMSGRDAREALMQVLSEGTEMLPIGECDDFDPKTGCRGHATNPEPIPDDADAPR